MKFLALFMLLIGFTFQAVAQSPNDNPLLGYDLWVFNSNVIQIKPVSITVTTFDNVGSTQIEQTQQGYLQANTIFATCTGDRSFVPDDSWGTKRPWLIYPVKYIDPSSGLELNLNITNWTKHTDSDPTHQAAYNQRYNVHMPGAIICSPQTGQIVDFQWPSPTPILQIRVNRNQTQIGQYHVFIPLYFAYEEQKTSVPSGQSSGLDDNFFIRKPDLINSIINQGSQAILDVTVNIQSSCSLDTHSLDLHHGQITLTSNLNTVTSPPATLALHCPGRQTIRAQLLGANRISGQPDNFTSCNVGSDDQDAACELQFTENNKGTDTLNFDNQYNLQIQSTYHKARKSIPGHFTGAGILKLTIE